MVQDPHVGPELGSNDPDLDSSFVGNTIPKRKIHMPSKESLKTAGGIAGKVLFTGAKYALTAARIGTNLASRGVNKIARSKTFSTSILTITSTLVGWATGFAVGVVNKELLGKKFNFIQNSKRASSAVKALATPPMKLLMPSLALLSGAAVFVTKESMGTRINRLIEKISEATGGVFSPENVASALVPQKHTNVNGETTINFDEIFGTQDQDQDNNPRDDDSLGH